MSSKLSNTVLGDNWFINFSKFRINPDSFLDRRKLSRNAFCLDVLKDLYSDYVEIQNKIHLLLLLQEFSVKLITDINLLEQIFESLTNLYKISGKKQEKRQLKSHILTSIVSILLSLNLDQDNSNFIKKAKIFLLEIIYDSKEDTVVVSSACCCLEELEIFYPGLLQSEIENIVLAFERETSPSFQSFALLLNTCIKQSLISYNEKMDRTKSENSSTPESYQISPVISNVLELLPLLSPTAQYRVLKNFMQVVKNTAELSPKAFKLYINGLAMSNEVPLFHLAFDLLSEFGTDLFTEQEMKQLLKQLIKLSIHPCLTSSHKLLYLEWLKSIIKYDKKMFSLLSFSDLKLLLSNPFDGPLAQEKKAHILASCIPIDCDDRLSGDFLNEVASGLIKCSLLLGGTRAAPSLFRTLFVYFSSQNSEAVYDFIYKLLTRIMKTSLHLTPYALSFIDSSKCYFNERKFHEKALDHMVEHILSVSVKQFQSNLECYLTILEEAAQENSSTCKPRAVLRLLQKLFNNKNIDIEKNWCTGNSILSLCRSLMKHHDVQIFYYDLAEVLCLIIQQFKDTDVRDRANIYYSMLTSLSKIKVQAIFSLQSSEKEGKTTLNSFVTGNESLQFASCIQKLSEPILQIIKCEQELNDSLSDSSNAVSFPNDIIEEYFQHINSFGTFLQIPFIIKHISDVENQFSELYSIVITTQSEPSCKEICDIEIPILKSNEMLNSQGKLILLRLIPKEPQPLSLHFKAEFTCSNGYSYVCYPQSITLDLENLFSPLPVPEQFQNVIILWRQEIFQFLWEKISNKIKSKEDLKCCESAYALNIKNEEFSSFVEKKWKKFIVSKVSPSEYNVAIHLPPLSHLLIKTCIVNNKPFVNFLIDNNATLPWIALYLQNLGEN